MSVRFLQQFGFVAFFTLLASGAHARAEERAAPSSPKVGAALQPFVDSHSLAGAVALVADKDKILSISTVGFADLTSQKPMRPDSLFWIASQSKSITAAALMILVDEGKVKLDDPVAKYLPEFNEQWLAVERNQDHVLLKKPSRAVTVRHVLSHTSGMPFSSLVEQPTLDGLALRCATRSYALTPLASEPGAKYAYANAGINTAGCIVEVVSGMPYEKFLHERLCQPLGMDDTTFWPNHEQLSRLAKSYRPNRTNNGLEATTIGQLRYPLNDRTRQPMPAGGLFSTANDVARFCQMMLNGGTLQGKRILSEALVQEMTKDQTGALKAGYGLGWSVNGTTFGHGGAMSTNMTVDVPRGLITVFLVQHAGFPGNGGQAQQAFRQAALEATK
jgi:CubicO group peptidase (beta-lactamase class C family)